MRTPSPRRALAGSIAALTVAAALTADPGAQAQLTWDTSPAAGVTGGAGFWNTTLANAVWTADAGATNVPWSNATPTVAIFGDVGGLVTIDAGNIDATGLTFDAAGYTIAGTLATDTLTLSGPAAVTANFNAAISAIIAGTSGLAKTGTGTLTLSGANTFTGALTIDAGAVAAGAVDVLADTASLVINTGGTYSLGANTDTLAALTLGGGALTGSGTLTASTLTLDSGSAAASLVIGTAFNKTGAGTVTLSGAANSFTVGSKISAGLLKVTNVGALGASEFEVAGGTLGIGVNAMTTGLKLSGGTVAPSGLATARTFGGVLNITGAATINLADAETLADSDLNVSGAPTGAGTLTVTANASNATSGKKLRLQNVAPGGSFTGTVKVEPNAILQVVGGGTTISGLGGGATIELNTGVGVTNGTTNSGRFELITATSTDYGNAVVVTGSSTIIVGNGSAASNQALSLGSLSIGTHQLNVNQLTTTGYTLTIVGATTLTGSPTFDIVSAPLILNNVTDGAGTFGFTKQGTGELRLVGTGTFDGPATLAAGTLNLGTSTALGTGTLTIGGGTVTTTAALTGAGKLANALALTANGNFTGAGGLEFDGAVDLGGAARIITTTLTGGLILNGVVSNDAGGGLTKSGTGALTLAGASANTFTGNTTVTAGALNLNKTAALPSAGTISISGTASINVADGISQTVAGITLAGTSSVNVANGATGGVLVLGGDLAANNITGTVTLGATGAGAVTGAFDLGGAARTLTSAGGGTTSLTASVINGPFVKAGAGTLSLNNTTGSGSINTNFTVDAGAVTFAANDQIGDTRSVTVNGGSFNLNGRTDTFQNLTITGPSSTSTATAANGSLTLNGTLAIDALPTNTVASLSLSSPSTLTANKIELKNGTNTSGQGAMAIGANGVVANVGAGGLEFTNPATGTGTFFAIRFNSATTGTSSRLKLGGDVVFLGNGTNSNSVSVTADTTNAVRGGIDLNGNRIFNIGDGAAALDLTIAAQIADGTAASALIKTGDGTLALTAGTTASANTYTGGTQIKAGTLAIGGNASALGTGPVALGDTTGSAAASLLGSGTGATHTNAITVNAGTSGLLTIGTLGGTASVFTGGVTLANNLTTSTVTGSVNFNTVGIGGTGNLTVTSSSTGLTTLSVANTFTGNINLQSGDLQLGNLASLGNAANVLNANGGLLRANATLTGANAIPNSVVVAGNFSLGGTSNFDLAGNFSGSGTLTKVNSSIVKLAGATNTFSGPINFNGGTLAADSEAQLGNAANTLNFDNGGLLRYSTAWTLTPTRNLNLNGTAGGGLDTQANNSNLPNLLTGAGAFVKAGGTLAVAGTTPGSTFAATSTGVLTLTNNANNFTGGITLTGGVLSVSNVGQLGSGSAPINFNGGGLFFSENVTTSRGLTVTASYTTGNAGPLGVAIGRTAEFTGPIAGTGTMRFDSGYASNATNTSTGTMPVSTVILSGSGNNGAGSFVLSGYGVLAVRGGVTIGSDNPALGNLALAGNGVLELGAFDLTRALGTAANQIQMASSVGAGFAAFGADRFVAIGGAATPTALTWGTTSFLFSGGNAARNLLFGSSTATHTVDFRNALNLNNTTGTVSRVLLAVDGPASREGLLSGQITKSGAGTTTLFVEGTGAVELSNGTNSGAYTTIVRGGSLLLGANATTGAGNTVLGDATSAIQVGDTAAINTLGTNTAAALLINGAFEVSRPVTVNTGNAGTATFGGFANATSTFSGPVTLNKSARLTSAALGANKVIVSGAISGATSALTKIGAGIAELSNATGNTFGGGATVSEGTLLVSNASGSATGAGTVTVDAAGTLGGTGLITGAVNVSGTLAPGASPGVLSTGNLTFNSGAKFALELNSTIPGTGYDQASVTGSVSLNGGDILLTLGFTPTIAQDVFFIVLNDLADAVTGTFAGLPQGGTFSSGGQFFQISYTADSTAPLALDGFNSLTGNDVALLAVIPEPGTAVSLLGGLASLLGLQRFRRRR